MNGAESFAEFFSRVRANDQTAAQRLVDLYGPLITQIAGRRLRQCGLSNVVDPADISQEVFMNFFGRVVPKRDLASWEQLAKLLVTMAVNRIRDEWRHAHALRHGFGQQPTERASLDAMVSSADEPGHDLEIEDEINQLRKLLSAEEWNLAWAWATGKTWDEIAAEPGQRAEALRKKFSWLCARIKDYANADGSAETPRP